MKEKIPSIKSQQIAWRQIYHIWANTPYYLVFLKTLCFVLLSYTMWSDPERQKPVEDSSLKSFQRYSNSFIYCISSPWEALAWIAICGCIFFKELHEYFKCNLAYYVIDLALFMLRFSLIIKVLQSAWWAGELNFFFAFRVINSGVIATVNSQEKCIGFLYFVYGCEKVNTNIWSESIEFVNTRFKYFSK